jgi:transposase-like protein
MASVLSAPYFHDEQAAFAALEAIMWPNGKPDACPHCGVVDKARRLAPQRSKPSARNPEGKPVYGLWKCYACRKQFTVRKGTIFEESRLELHLWFQAAHLMCSSKKGVSANQLHRTLGVTLKTAWFLAHRLRDAPLAAGAYVTPYAHAPQSDLRSAERLGLVERRVVHEHAAYTPRYVLTEAGAGLLRAHFERPAP